jgi:hypothetical protein
MNTQASRWGGLAFLIAGGFQIFGSVFHGDNADPLAILNPMWVAVQLALLAFYVLSCVGLWGLSQSPHWRAGWLGKVGFGLALLGSAATVITSVGFAFPLPAYAAQQATPKPLMELLDPAGPLAWLFYVTLAYVVLFVPGYVLVGISVMRSPGLPRWAGLLIALGILASFMGAGLPGLFIARIVGGVVFALGLMWLGYALWAPRSEARVAM